MSPKRKRGEDSLLTDKLDRATSELARLRRPYCEYCRWLAEDDTDLEWAGGVLHAHHNITRGNRKLRWDDRNIIVLCYRHHFHDGPHGDWIMAQKYREFVLAARGQDVRECERLAPQDGKLTLAEKRDLLAALRAEIEEAKALA